LFVAVLVAASALLAAPAGAAASSSALAKVKVTGATGAKPKLRFSTPFRVSRTSNRVVTAGTGADIGNGARISVDYVLVDGRTGKQIESSYGKRPASLLVDAKQSLGPLVTAVQGRKVGTRVLVAIAPRDGIAKNLATVKKSGVKKDDTVLVLLDVTFLHPQLSRATGTPVAPAAGLPTVTLAADGKPSVAIPGGTPPATLVAQLLVRGAGTTVTAGQTIHVHYVGVVWATGKQFDSSWDRGTPADFTIVAGQVIKGWVSGLVGQTVGSQVLLVVPPDQGYGAQGQTSAGIGPNDTLVFVVDILDAY